MGNLALIFCSITPAQYSDEINALRIEEYKRSIAQLKKVCSFNYLILDNTEYSKGKDFIHVPENIGTINKGLGELAMLKYAVDNKYTVGYNRICYITGRHLWICPYFFEHVEKMQSGILVSNPDYIYINGDYHQVEQEGLYNDMAFSMYNELIKEYVNYIDFNDKKTGSEQWLYKFVHQSKQSYEMISHLGLIRNDWQKTKDYINLDNYHGV